MDRQAFYVFDGEYHLPTALTRGPWHDQFQHGGPPAALMARAIAEAEGGEDFLVARVWIDILKPYPRQPMKVRLERQESGKIAERYEARLVGRDGTIYAVMRGLRIRRVPVALGADRARADLARQAPAPSRCRRFDLTFFSEGPGYHHAIELRVVEGVWAQGPMTVWGRVLVPLVEGSPTRPLERLMILADAQSGMGPPVDPLRYYFANPDFSAHLDRYPEGDWIGFRIQSTAQEHGLGLAESELFDEAGLLGRAAQTLVVADRRPAK